MHVLSHISSMCLHLLPTAEEPENEIENEGNLLIHAKAILTSMIKNIKSKETMETGVPGDGSLLGVISKINWQKRLEKGQCIRKGSTIIKQYLNAFLLAALWGQKVKN